MKLEHRIQGFFNFLSSVFVFVFLYLFVCLFRVFFLVGWAFFGHAVWLMGLKPGPSCETPSPVHWTTRNSLFFCVTLLSPRAFYINQSVLVISSPKAVQTWSFLRIKTKRLFTLNHKYLLCDCSMPGAILDI